MLHDDGAHLVTLIDSALRGVADRDGMFARAEVVNLLLDLRLAALEIAELERPWSVPAYDTKRAGRWARAAAMSSQA
jgi:hypothetical protein